MRRRSLCFCVIVLLGRLSTAAAAPGTVLLDFENPEHDALFTRETSPAAAVVGERAAQGRKCLKLGFEKYEPGKGQWPGLSFTTADVGAPADWTRYAALLVDVATANEAGSEIGFTLAGPEGTGTWHAYAPVPAGEWTTLRFPLADIAAQMELKDVRRVGILMRRPPEATTLFVDHFRLVPWDVTGPEAAEILLRSPALNASFYHTNPEQRVAVALKLRAPGEEWRGTRFRLSLLGSDGRSLGTTEVRGEDAGASVTLALPRPKLRDGEGATARVEVLRDGKKVRGEEFRLTQRPPGRDEVCLRDDGVALVNGKPFFPFGMYQSPAAEFETLRRMGFNTAQTYVPADADYLDAAAKAGLRVITSIKGTYAEPPHYHETLWKEQDVAEYVRSIKGAPALLAHYLFDEPSPGRTPPAKLRELCDIVRREDPYHLAVGCNNNYQSAYRRVPDAMMVDSYPVPGPMTNLIARAREGAQAQEPGLAMWFIPQAFPWEPYFRARDGEGSGRPVFSDGRLPTFDEARTMPWIAIALGAKGLIYYSWQVQGFAIRDAYPVFWKGFEYHVAETAALLPWLTEPAAPAGPPLPPQSWGGRGGQWPPARCDDPAVFVATRRRGKDLLIAAANSAREKKEVVATVPGLAGRALHVVSEERSIRPERDRVRVVLAPMETRLFVTSREGLPSLPALESIRAELARMEREFRAEYPSVCTVQQGATLEASWGFPKVGQASWFAWYRMIDGWPGTPWVVGQAFRSEGWGGIPAGKVSEPGRWIEVRFPKPQKIDTVRAIASPWAETEVQLFAGGEWRTVKGERTPDAVRRHPGHPSATTTARFQPVETDRFRVLFPKARTQTEVVFELSAFLTP